MREGDASEAGTSEDPQVRELQWLAGLRRQIDKLPERAMRSAIVANALALRPPAIAARQIERICSVQHRGSSSDPRLLLATIEAIDDNRFEYAFMQSVYTEAVAQHLEFCRELLLSVAVPVDDSGESPPRSLQKGQRPLTLGERMTLARGWRCELLPLLLRDPDPKVLAIALNNPRVREPDIVALAAYRYCEAHQLVMIARHPHWRRQSAVRRALVQNPRLPLGAALRIVPILNSQERRQIANSSAVPEALRKSLRRGTTLSA